MMQLDLNKVACVGAPRSKRHRIHLCVEKRCEGCGAKIYMSSNLVRQSERDARRDGVETVLVCWKCAEPWVQEIARHGGEIEGQESIVRDEVMPRIERAADDQLHSN